MSRLFGRTTLLQLGNQTVADSYEGLRIRFSVTKTLGGKPNSGNIEVYGLNRDTIAAYLAADRDLRVRLLAGYQGAPSLIFDGFPAKKEGLVFSKTGAERILKIKAKDGLRRYEKARVSKSFGQSSTFEDVLVEVAGGLGLPVSTIEVPPDVKLTQGVHLNGFAKDVLDRLALSANADWSIQDGKFQFIQKRGRLRGQGPLFSDERNNIVGDIRRKDKGIELTTFVQGTITPGVIFEVSTGNRPGGVSGEDAFFNGTWKAKEVKYTGDSFYDNDYYCVITGVPFETQAEGEARLLEENLLKQIDNAAGDVVEAIGTNLSKVLEPGADVGDTDFN